MRHQALKQSIRARQNKLAWERRQKIRQIPEPMIRLYVCILKYGYRPECKESLLTPGHYVVDLYDDFELRGQLTTYKRETITLHPVGTKTRF